MLRLTLLILVIFSFVLAFCDSSTSGTHITPVIADNSVTASQNKLFESMPQFTRLINLPSMQSGVDSLEYRLWLHVSADIICLIRIQNVNSSWEISETVIESHIPEYRYNQNDTINHLLETIIDSISTRKLTPNIQLPDFLDSMQYFNLQEAPLNIRIQKAYSLPADSWRYTFEVADSKNYRIIEFNCAEYFDLHEFKTKMIQMLQFLKRTLGVEFTDCY